MEVKKIKGLTIKFTNDCMTIEDSYKIRDIDKIEAILNEALEKTDEFISLRHMKTFINQWVTYNNLYSLHLFRGISAQARFSASEQTKGQLFLYSLLSFPNRIIHKISSLNIKGKIKKNGKLYKQYIKQHKDNVLKAFDEMNENFIIRQIVSPELLDKLYARALIHDDSKYSDEEFDAYRKNFFPINQQEKENNKKDFDKAWEHHWQNNSHHWQHRQYKQSFNKNNDEEVLDVLENVLDWMAMGYQFNDRPYQYYNNNKEHIILNDDERKYLEYIIFEAIDKERINEDGRE